MTTSNATPKAQATPQRHRAITTPVSTQGTSAVVRIERRKGERVQGLWAEGIPYRHLAELRRVQPITAEPLLLRTEKPKGCATGTACMGHPDCADTQCQGHPDNSDEQKAFDLRGKDYSDYHGPITPEERVMRAKVWRAFLAGLVLFWAVVAAVLWN
jgi:hypothetical protein